MSQPTQLRSGDIWSRRGRQRHCAEAWASNTRSPTRIVIAATAHRRTRCCVDVARSHTIMHRRANSRATGKFPAHRVRRAPMSLVKLLPAWFHAVAHCCPASSSREQRLRRCHTSVVVGAVVLLVARSPAIRSESSGLAVHHQPATCGARFRGAVRAELRRRRGGGVLRGDGPGRPRGQPDLGLIQPEAPGAQVLRRHRLTDSPWHPWERCRSYLHLRHIERSVSG